MLTHPWAEFIGQNPPSGSQSEEKEDIDGRNPANVELRFVEKICCFVVGLKHTERVHEPDGAKERKRGARNG